MICYLRSSADTRPSPSLFFHCMYVRKNALGLRILQEPFGTTPYQWRAAHTGRAKATYQLKRRRKALAKTNPTSEGRGLLLLDKQNLPYTGTNMSTFNNIYSPLPLTPRKVRTVGQVGGKT